MSPCTSKIESEHQVWQEGSHPQVIRSDEVMLQKLDYLHNNPVKRGLVPLPELWPWSSFRAYMYGERSVVKIEELEPLKTKKKQTPE